MLTFLPKPVVVCSPDQSVCLQNVNDGVANHVTLRNTVITKSNAQQSTLDGRSYRFNGMVAPFLNGIKSAKVGVFIIHRKRGDQYEHYYNRD